MRPVYMKNILMLAVTVIMLSGAVFAQVSITQLNATQNETFDGIGTSATATLPSGWRITTTPTPAPGTINNYGGL
jgi:hypothetical protein